MNAKPNIIRDKSFDLAVMLVELYKELSLNKKEFILSKQLLRSGTSVGANVREAQNAQSKNDFIYKLSIAQKECDETLYWLELLRRTDYLNSTEYEAYESVASQLLRIIRSSILTAKRNLHK